MLRTFALGIASLALICASTTFAVVPDKDSASSKNFGNMARQMRSLGGMSDAAEFSAVMADFHSSMTANLDLVPSIMEAGTEAYDEYLEGLRELIGKIEEAKALADAGDLDGAKAITATFRDMREEWHEHFNIEDE